MSNVETSKTTRRKRPAQKAKKSRATASRTKVRDIGELERIIQGLENRINELTSRDAIKQTVAGATGQVSDVVSNVVNRATSQVGEYVTDSLFGVASRVRDGATSVTGVAKTGTNAMQRVGAELEKRPLMTVAIALGIGFLAGLAGRRDAA